MLYLSRRVGESIIINDVISVKVIEIHGKTVKLGLDYPSGVKVLRHELLEKINAENKAAVESALFIREALK